ncbi:MAG TPA: hypothetical protein VKU82_01015 [Planctomycetaceae bacterium]|nr:hypothetical protein [Planctomycetaceae bacterium]
MPFSLHRASTALMTTMRAVADHPFSPFDLCTGEGEKAMWGRRKRKEERHAAVLHDVSGAVMDLDVA